MAAKNTHHKFGNIAKPGGKKTVKGKQQRTKDNFMHEQKEGKPKKDANRRKRNKGRS